MKNIPTDNNRFWSRVDKTGKGGCWIWRGYVNKKGYGMFSSYTGSESGGMCHRISWYLINGKIPDNLCVLHKCDNPPCVNPGHLFLGTKTDNNRDAREKLRHQFGQYHHRAKFSHAQVLALRSYHIETGIGYRRLARKFDVSNSTMRDLLSGKTYALANEKQRS
jgi:hypothetical protein